jgi:hypothetical protein
VIDGRSGIEAAVATEPAVLLMTWSCPTWEGCRCCNPYVPTRRSSYALHRHPPMRCRTTSPWWAARMDRYLTKPLSAAALFMALEPLLQAVP